MGNSFTAQEIKYIAPNCHDTKEKAAKEVYDFEEHCNEDDFVLVPNVIPTLKLSKNKRSLETIDEASELTEDLGELQTEEILTNQTSYEYLSEEYRNLMESHDALKTHYCIYEKLNDRKTNKVNQLEKEIADLQSHLAEERACSERYEEALEHFLSRAKRRPTDSLRRWVVTQDFCHDILREFHNVMEPTDGEKVVVLQCGKMNVYGNDKVLDEAIGCRSYMQVVMATSLFGNWKQPVYVDFDMKLTRRILHDSMEKLHEMSCSVVACISDYNEDVRDLWKEMKINSNRTYFPHPVTAEKVYFFVSAPSLLINIHDRLLDEGFTLSSGTKISGKLLKRLLIRKQRLSTFGKQHLEPIGEDRRKLKLAVELFCAETAADLKQMSPCRDKTYPYATGLFYETIGRWYAIASKSYCFPEQQVTLNATSDMICSIVTSKDSVRLLRDALIASISSLRLLFVDLWKKCNTINIICTEKLSNIDLYDLFAQICREKNGNDGLAPLEAVH